MARSSDERGDRLPVRASGRLGNLLFQYSLVLYARKNGRAAYLDAVRSAPAHVRDLLSMVAIPADEIEFSRLPARLETLSWAASTHAALHRLAWRGVATAERRGIASLAVPDFVDGSPLADLVGARRAGGYFQSADLVDAVFDDLRMRLVPALRLKFEQSSSETVLHVRIGDYADLPGFNVLAPDYYARALVASGGTTKDEVVIVTDSPQSVGELFRDFRIVEISSESPGRDFLRVAQAERKIISNSTFAWWAARLGVGGAAANVVGPRPWLANGDGSGLYTASWTWLNSDARFA